MTAVSPDARRDRRVDATVAALLGVACLAVYLYTMCPTFSWGDSSELTTAAYFLGIGHSPGYPTWMLVAFPFAHLPFGTVAWRVNAMNALLGAVAVALLYFLLLRLTKSRVGAVVGALSFALTATFWDLTNEADVFTLYACLAALVLLLAFRWREQRRDRTVYLLAWLLGLSLGNHALILLLAPALLFLLIAEAGIRSLAAKRVVFVVLFVLLGLAIYAYIPIRAIASPPPVQNDPTGATLGQLLRETWVHITAPQARVAMFSESLPIVLHRALAYTARLKTEFCWGGVLLGLVGIAFLARRDWKLLVFLLLVALVDIAYAANFSIFDIYAYYLPLYLAWAAFIAAGAAGLLALAQGLFASAPDLGRPRSPMVTTAAVTIVLLYAPLWQYGDSFSKVNRHDDRSAERYARFVLQHLPPKSALLADWWVIAPVGYLKYVEGLRTDVTLSAAPSVPTEEGVRKYAKPAFLDLFPAVYFTESITQTMGLFRESAYLVPEGPVWRVLARRPPVEQVLAKLPPAPRVRFGDQIGLVYADVPSESLAANQLFPLTLYWTPLNGYTREPLETILMLRAATGEVIWREAVPIGNDLYPREQWQPGQVLREQHAIYLQGPPDQAGDYDLLVRLRRRGEGETTSLLSDHPTTAERPYDTLLGRVQVTAGTRE